MGPGRSLANFIHHATIQHHPNLVELFGHREDSHPSSTRQVEANESNMGQAADKIQQRSLDTQSRIDVVRRVLQGKGNVVRIVFRKCPVSSSTSGSTSTTA